MINLYLSEVDKVVSSFNVDHRIAGLVCPRFHYPENVHPAGNGVITAGFLIHQYPQVRAQCIFKLTKIWENIEFK